MSDLLGAWSLDNVPARRRISALDEAAMLPHLPGHPDGLGEVAAGPLWLVGARAKVSRAGPTCLGFEGLLVGDGALAAMAPDARPEGHFVLARADLEAGKLTLLRGLSGGERLYYARLPGLVLFAASIRPLLAHPRIGRTLRRSAIDEVLLSGLVMSGEGSLIEGIEEVQPGHRLEIGREVGVQRWHWEGLLEPLEGDVATLAREYRRCLGGAVEAAIGGDGRVAVSLSGGIDSSAIAALAVECVGPGNVEAFTYEFDDPSHPPETPFAVEVCRHLGIRRHHVFRIGFADYLAAIPEVVWRAESPVHWPKAFMLPAARRIMAHGHDKFLSGFGIGSHMAHLEDLARLLAALPSPDMALRYWRLARSRRWRFLDRLRLLHPCLEPLYPRLQLLLLAVLSERGMITELGRHYPEIMAPLLGPERDVGRGRCGFAAMGLEAQLRHRSFARLVSCIDVTRWEKVLREIGAHRLSPAHFAQCLPYSYMPIRPRPNPWSVAGRLRPGKLLLREAMRGVLPDSVLLRRKSWADAVVSPGWYRAGLNWMRSVLPRGVDCLGNGEADYRRALRYWEPRSPQATPTALRFWHRVVVEKGIGTRPPGWRDLARE